MVALLRGRRLITQPPQARTVPLPGPGGSCSPAWVTPGADLKLEGMTMKTLGEFGRDGGKKVVEVVLVRGHSAEIRKLWRALDDADAPEQDSIFRRLGSLGAVRSETRMEG